MTGDSAQHLAILQARNKAYRWAKSTSGCTPLARCYHQARALARRSSPEMMERLVELARSSADDRVASACAMAVLNRAGVKPIDYDPAEERRSTPKFNAEDFSDEELEQIEAALRLIIDLSREKALQAPPLEPE